MSSVPSHDRFRFQEARAPALLFTSRTPIRTVLPLAILVEPSRQFIFSIHSHQRPVHLPDRSAIHPSAGCGSATPAHPRAQQGGCYEIVQ